MTAERTKSKIGRWVDETMKGKFDNFVGSRKKSNSSSNAKINNEIPTLPDADENVDADLLHSVKPAELNTRITESVYDDQTTRPPISLNGVDLEILFSNMTRKQDLDDVRITASGDERDTGRMIQQHMKLLNIGSDNACVDEPCST